MIEISGVSKTFPARGKDAPVLALKDVDLRIEDGEFLTILGPSGCGKTTLLRMIDGLVEWDKGEITVNGTPVRGPGPDRAMVFQAFALMPWATVRDNVAFGLRRRRDLAESEIRDRVAHALELVDLPGTERRIMSGKQATTCSSKENLATLSRGVEKIASR